MFTFRRIMAFVGILFLVLVITAAVMVYQAHGWVKQMTSSTPANFPPLSLTRAENEEVDRLVKEIYRSHEEKSVVEASVSANVFNGIIERINEYRRKDKGEKEEEQTRIRLDLGDKGTKVLFSVPSKDPQTGTRVYVNGEVLLDVEIADGQLKEGRVDSIKVNEKEAPFIVRKVIENGISEMKKGIYKKPDGSTGERPKELKLLRREGDKIHIILDGKEFKGD